MKAVFLDNGTFLDSVPLPAPDGIDDYVTFNSTAQDDAFIIERCQDADIIITNKVGINDNVISALPRLKLIQLTATGKNNVDEASAKKHHVTVYNVAGYAKKSVPEHTFMLMLNGMRAGIYYHNKVINGDWYDSGKFTMTQTPLLELEDKVLGIMGAGSIGKRVTQIAQGFGMRVLWAEHRGKQPRNSDYTAFDEVLKTADVLSLHLPLTDKTEHLINAETIAKMARRPLIVNVARGGLVDSKAIVEAIQSENILGYASDVFATEPAPTDDPIVALAKSQHPRVVLSPHNAWGSITAQNTLWGILSQQVTQFINDAKNKAAENKDANNK